MIPSRMKKVNPVLFCTAPDTLLFCSDGSVAALNEQSDLTFFFCAERQYFHLANVKWSITEGGQESFRNFSSPSSSCNCCGTIISSQGSPPKSFSIILPRRHAAAMPATFATSVLGSPCLSSPRYLLLAFWFDFTLLTLRGNTCNALSMYSAPLICDLFSPCGNCDTDAFQWGNSIDVISDVHWNQTRENQPLQQGEINFFPRAWYLLSIRVL